MNVSRPLVAVVSIYLFILTNPVSAQLIYSDNFNYPDGLLVGASGSPWVNNYPPAGQVNLIGNKVFLTDTEVESVRVDFPGVGSNNIYASFTINFTSLPAGLGNYFASFRYAGIDNNRARIWAGTNTAAPGKFRLGTTSLSSPVFVPVDLSTGQTYTVVVRYNITNTISTIWINPLSEADSVNRGETGSETFQIGIGHFAFFERGEFNIGIENTIGKLFVDNLRIGRSFAAVTTFLLPPQVLPNQVVTIKGFAPTGISFTIQANSNLLTTNWTALGNAISDVNGVVQFTDSQATNHASRFYRLVTP